MNLVRCRRSWDCTACAFATIFDLTYEEVIAKLGHDGSEIVRPGLPDPDCRRGFHPQEVIDVSERLGYILTPFEARPSSIVRGIALEVEIPEGYACRFHRHLEDQVGVLIGRNLKNRPHAVVWDGSSIHDPANGEVYGTHLFQAQTFWRILTEHGQTPNLTL